MIYAFNDAGKGEIKSGSYKTCIWYDLYQKAQAGTLTRADKNRLTEKFIDCSCNHSIKCMGVMYDFSEWTKTYVYKQFGSWFEQGAIDKTALRAAVYGRIDKILEVK